MGLKSGCLLLRIPAHLDSIDQYKCLLRVTVVLLSPHVPDVGEQEQQLGLPPRLLLGRAARLADVVYEGVGDGVQHVLHGRAVVQRLHGAGAEGEGTWWRKKKVTSHGGEAAAPDGSWKPAEASVMMLLGKTCESGVFTGAELSLTRQSKVHPAPAAEPG